MTIDIKAISFDLDNTLWHADPVLLAAEKAMSGWLRENAAPILEQLTREQVVKYKKALIAQSPALIHHVSDIRKQLLKVAALDAGYANDEAETIAKRAFDVFYQARQQVTLFEPVIPVLEELASQYRLISITNGNSNPEIIGLSRYFEFSISAESEGVGKPDPEIFKNALNRLGLLPEEVAHVGDHLKDDIDGANQVGLKTVWINLTQEGAEHSADAEITCISQLPIVIKQLKSVKLNHNPH